MVKISILVLFLLFQTDISAKISEEEKFIESISKIYIAAMNHIFKSQRLINRQGGDKSSLFGQYFINDLMVAYKNTHNEKFPIKSSRLQTLLLKSMVDVMEENKTLINDSDLAFKGFIPATFAFQVAEKLSRKGVGIKLKFTNKAGTVRNPLNSPDEWEEATMQKFNKSKHDSFFDEFSIMNGIPSYRYFTPLKLKPYCFNCHGVPADNPLNKGREKSEYTDIDMSGFKMENWNSESFSGGLSITIYKKDFMELEELCEKNYISSYTCHFFSLE
jgi:hypothetical protein